ncbi:MAG: Spy0128 family protein, partial [Suipraeoptans sp.]
CRLTRRFQAWMLALVIMVSSIPLTSYASVLQDEDETNEIEISAEIIDNTENEEGVFQIEASDETTVKLTLRYQGLTKDDKYTLKGVWMGTAADQSIEELTEELSAKKSFVADDSNGEVEVEFEFVSVGLAGKEAVLFLYLYKDDEQVASHEDIEDEGLLVEFLELQNDLGNLTDWGMIVPMDATVNQFNFSIGKRVDGVDYTGNEYTFRAVWDEWYGGYHEGGYDHTVTTTSSGVVTFPTITYTQMGRYRYIVTEIKGTDTGIIYDETVYHIVVDVSNGGIVTNVTYYYLNENGREIRIDESSPTAYFDNVTKKVPVTPEITARKTLDGNYYSNQSEFSFELFEGYGGTEKSIDTQYTTGASGVINFDTSSIEYDSAGEHYYFIREKAYSGTGNILMDETVYQVKITVSESGGALVATNEYNKVTVGSGGDLIVGESVTVPVFENTTITEVEVIKTWLDNNGDSLDPDSLLIESVTVELKYRNVYMPSYASFSPKQTLTLTKAGNWKGKFENLNYYDTFGNVIDYTVAEVSITYAAGVTEAQKAAFTISIGQSVNTSTGTSRTITNRLRTVTPEIEANKTLDGEEYEGALFEFELFEGYKALEVSIDKQTSVTGGVISFDTSNIKLTAAGTYEYYIRENAYSGVGILIDSTVYRVEVEIISASGVLTIDTIKYFNADTDEAITGTPTFENKSLTELEVIKVWLDDAGTELNPGTEIIESITVELKYKNTSGDFVSFSPKKTLVLTKAGDWKGSFTNLEKYDADGKELEYTIEEIDVQYAAGITDANKPSFEVTIDDPEETKDGQQITITNKFKGKIIVKKKDDNGKDLEDIEFTLNEAEVAGDGTWSAKAGGLTFVEVTKADGSAVFDNLPAGNYLLTETKGKEGLSLLAEPVKITIPYEGSGGNITSGVPGITGEGSTSGTYYYNLTYTITNGELFDMPEPGGGGIYTFYILGLFVLLLGTSYGIFMSKRRKAHLKDTN